MAGLRVGYGIGQAPTMKPMAQLKMPYNVSVFGVAAALAAFADTKHIEEERARNTEVRAFTVKALEDLGFKSSDSQCNFLFVDVGRPADEFRDACAKHGIMVGRPFPPLEKSHARISLGTMEEMKKATTVFRNVLRPVTTTAGRQ
jgi:histidinol-phosphate aminotransferase